jgi:serine/threonine protein kinase
MNEAETPREKQPQGQKLPHAVFISYSNEDKAMADAVCAALEADNIGCWIAPRDVQGGRPYSGQITQAIREARILLLILTGAANRSKHVLREVERAAHCQNHLLTFRVEPIAPGDDLAYFLGADQWVDGFRPLPPSQHFPALVQHTRKLLQSSAAEQEPEELSDTAPETFAHFRILRHADGSLFRLGKGGMGVTYKAIDTVLNRPVALKVIAAELLRSPQARHRFLREAQAAALIHHPHVATIHHFGEEEDAYFYAMEFVEGEDLERYVGRRGPLTPATALRVVLQVAQALEAAHARQLIHRDIKPGNIMAVINRAGSLDVKLIDFGLAKGAGSEILDAARITRTQDFVGSPAFASPEQCETKKLDIRSDIYSLGVTLWYLLSGKRPFSGSVGEVMIAQVIKPPPFDQLAHLPEPVLDLLRRMLAKSPDDRFQGPQELQDAVEVIAARLASDFGTVPERIIAKAHPGKKESGSNGALHAEPPAPAEPVLLATLASSTFDTYLGVEVGAVIGSRYRLLEESREGNGGRFFLARDEETAAGGPPEVGLKLLHPGITADATLLYLLENEIEVIHQAINPNLVRYFRLERSAPRPFLVREWVHGFLLYDLLRWRRSLSAAELAILLGPVAATLDFVANNGLGLVDVSVRKILVACPQEIAREEFAALARGNAQDWNRCTLKLNPLSLAPLLFRSRNGWDRQTVVPSSRVLSMTQAAAGIRGSKAVRLSGRLVYELLSGHALRRGDSQTYVPLPELDQAGNEILRRACVATGSATTYRNCQEFWNALKENIVTAGRPTGVPVLPITPAPSALPPPASAPPPPKRMIMVWTILGGALIIALAIFGTVRFGALLTPIPSAGIVASTPTLASVATPPVRSKVRFVPITEDTAKSDAVVWRSKNGRVIPDPTREEHFEKYGTILNVQEYYMTHEVKVYIFRPDTTVKAVDFEDLVSGKYFLRAEQ